MAARGPDNLDVELADGRKQTITIHNPDADAQNLRVDLEESKGGQLIRDESTEDGAQ